MVDVCPVCGEELEEDLPPLSAMGERMWGRGLEDKYCPNPKCPRFGR